MKQAINEFQVAEYIVRLLQSYITHSLSLEWEVEQQSIGTDPFVFLMWKGPLGPPSPYEKDDLAQHGASSSS